MSEDIAAIGMGEGIVFAGGPKEIIMTSDHLTWNSWSCPLSKIAALYVDDGLIAVAGDRQLAVSMIRHRGKLWQVIELEDEPTCLHLISNKAFVGTHTGRLFEFKITRPKGLLDRLRRTSPLVELSRELDLGIEGTLYNLDHIEFGDGDD